MMRFVFYTHSLISDWNHGNAHFLRGVMGALQVLGHETIAMEPADSWSRNHLVAAYGKQAISAFRDRFPHLRAQIYGPDFRHESVIDKADVVVVHEWNDPALVSHLGRLRRQGGRFLLVFHDTHHRAVSANSAIRKLDLDDYDLVLAFGDALRQVYLDAGWGRQVVTWHEAADISLFKPPEGDIAKEGDLIWIGNWGDGERSQELIHFLVEPVDRLRLRARVHGVRYPARALRQLEAAGIAYCGWIANADAPDAFARHCATVHIPRRPYVEALPGIPTIRVFEALACGIPLVCAPWQDAEGLFRPGSDYLVVADGNEMATALRDILNDRSMAEELAASGLETIRARHTCRHRAEELLAYVAGHAPLAVRSGLIGEAAE